MAGVCVGGVCWRAGCGCAGEHVGAGGVRDDVAGFAAAREPLRRPQRSTLNRPALYTLRDQQRPLAVITIRNWLPVVRLASPQL